LRTAIIDINPEALKDVIGPLIDGGLCVNGSLDGRDGGAYLPFVRLVVSGEGLPEACDRSPGDPIRRVRPLFRLETYGDQRMTKIDSFDLDSDFRFFPPVR